MGFEVTKSAKNSKSDAIIHMQEKRKHDEKYISNFHKKIEETKVAKELEGEKNEAQKRTSNLEQCSQEDLQNTFSTVIGSKKEKQTLKRKSTCEEDSVNLQTNEPPKKKKRKKKKKKKKKKGKLGKKKKKKKKKKK